MGNFHRHIKVLSVGPLLLVCGCTYSGHSIKASMGRGVGDTVKGTEYTVGCEVQFKARASQ